MNNIIYFLFGVFIGNIIDIKYVLIIYFIYVIIKNDPLYDNIYPRTILFKLIIMITNKINDVKLNQNIVTIEETEEIEEIKEIEISDKIYINNEIKNNNTFDNQALKELLMLPPPPLLSTINKKIIK